MNFKKKLFCRTSYPNENTYKDLKRKDNNSYPFSRKFVCAISALKMFISVPDHKSERNRDPHLAILLEYLIEEVLKKSPVRVSHNI